MPERKNIRLRGYDYSQAGAYFCTVCVHRAHRHKELFAVAKDGSITLNRFGDIVASCWQQSLQATPGVDPIAFVVMPNHVHFLVVLHGKSDIDASRHFTPPAKGSLGLFVRAFKARVARAISEERGKKTLIWQHRFHDRIIRNDKELEDICRYIENNPARWIEDRYRP